MLQKCVLFDNLEKQVFWPNSAFSFKLWSALKIAQCLLKAIGIFIYTVVKNKIYAISHTSIIFNMTKQKSQKNSASKKIQLKPPAQSKTKSSRTKPITKKQLRNAILNKIAMHNFSKQKQVFKQRSLTLPATRPNWNQVVPLMSRDNLNCPICLDYCIYPILTQCGHYYCLQCFENAHKRLEFCCVCRGFINITDYQPSKSLQKLFDKFIGQNFDWFESVLYYARVEQINKRQSKRKIPESLQNGTKIDYKLNKTWIQVQIAQIIGQQLQLQYVNNLTNEVEKVKIPKRSRLLAAHRCYSLSKDLRSQAEVQVVYRIQRQIRRTVRRPIRAPLPIDHLAFADNSEQAHNVQPQEDRNNWQNLIQSSARNNHQWFAEEVEVGDRNWGVWLQNQPDDNDWIMGF